MRKGYSHNEGLQAQASVLSHALIMLTLTPPCRLVPGGVWVGRPFALQEALIWPLGLCAWNIKRQAPE